VPLPEKPATTSLRIDQFVRPFILIACARTSWQNWIYLQHLDGSYQDPLLCYSLSLTLLYYFYLKCMSAFSPSSIVSWIVGNADVRPDVFPASLPPAA
jgi:hypothetical protein